MPDSHHLVAAVVLAASITFALRALPFAIVEPLRALRLAAVLALRMPAGLMLILVVDLLRDVPHQAPAAAMAQETSARVVPLAVPSV